MSVLLFRDFGGRGKVNYEVNYCHVKVKHPKYPNAPLGLCPMEIICRK